MQENNQETLASFEKYCQEHPGERFWQALRNWSEQDYILFGHTSNIKGLTESAVLDGVKVYVEDTFNKSGQKD